MSERELLVPVVLAFTAVLACEQRFSSNPPPLAPRGGASASPSAIDALLAPGPADAGAAPRDTEHAMTITRCSMSTQPCPPSDEGISAEATYRVVFGSGRAAIRSRGQAMADLYKEVRDRTSAGEHLDAESHVPGRPGALPVGSGRASKSDDSEGSDPVSKCAFHLLDMVDGVGEITLDVLRQSGSADCIVSLGRSPDGRTVSQCLIDAPERPKPRPSGGLSF